jgi:uncharacterized Zn finger protein (UPF0148 family)
MNCPICGKELTGNRTATCGDSKCIGKRARTRPSSCACGKPGVRRSNGEWACQRCIDFEAAYYAGEMERQRRIRDEQYHNTRAELGWLRYLETEWIPEERRREKVLTMRQQLATPL